MIRPGDIIPILYKVQAECRVLEVRVDQTSFMGEIMGGALDGDRIEVAVTEDRRDDDDGEEWKCLV
jgi:hypothetical protein